MTHLAPVRRREDRRGTLEMNFVITGDSDTSDKWAMRATGYGWPVSVTREDAQTFVLETAPPALIRLAECTSLTPGQLLSLNCLICGKALTDPASMARLIGPECAGTASLRVPWIVSLLETPGAA